MGDAPPLQILQGGQEVVAEPLQQVQVQVPLFQQPRSQRLAPRGLQHQAHPAGDRNGAHQAHEVPVVKPRQDLGLGGQPGVVGQIAGQLQHPLLILVQNQEGHRDAALAQAPQDHQVVGQAVARSGIQGVGGRLVLHVLGGAQALEDVVDLLEERLGAGGTLAHLGSGAAEDQVVQFLGHAVLDRRKPQAAVLFQQLAQAHVGRRRGTPGEDGVTQGAQREDVGILARLVGRAERLGSHVGGGLGLHQLMHVDRAGRAAFDRPGLPVAHLQLRVLAIRGVHLDAEGAEAPMQHLPGVGVAQGFHDLAPQIQALLDSQRVEVGVQELLQAQRVRLVLEDQRRAMLVHPEVLRAQDSRVAEGLDQPVLPFGGPADLVALLLGGGLGDQVVADALGDAGQGLVLGQAVLVTGTFAQDLAQAIVPDGAALLEPADTGLVQGLMDAADVAAVQGRRASLTFQRPDDADPRRLGPLLANGDVLEGVGLQVTLQGRVGQEDQRLDVGQSQSRLAVGGLGGQEALEDLGLLVGQVERVVQHPRAVPVLEIPGGGIPLQVAGEALDLDQVQAVPGEDEQVHLVDGPVQGHELEVRPGSQGPTAKAGPHVVEGFLLPGELGGADHIPDARGGRRRAGHEAPSPEGRGSTVGLKGLPPWSALEQEEKARRTEPSGGL